MPQQFVAQLIERAEVLPANAIVRLAVPRAVSDAATSGQFLMVHPSSERPGASAGRDPLLPRPFSIMRAQRDGDTGALDLLVFTGGRGGNRLARAPIGEEFAALGPLGKGYQIGERVRQALLVAAGHGVAPLVGLAETLLARGVAVTILLGAANAAQLLPLSCLPDEAEVVVATGDGSRGQHGPVTALVTGYVEWADAIYAYLPESLYADLRETLQRYRGPRRLPPVQVALERAMACATGVCLGCVIETTSGLKTVCRDGPVFALEQLQW